MVESWLGKLRLLSADIGRSLMTPDEFEYSLQEILAFPGSPLISVLYTIAASRHIKLLSLGRPGEGDPANRKTFSLLPTTTTCTLDMWPRNDVSDPTATLGDAIIKPLTDLIEAFWKPSTRDEVSGLPSLKGAPGFQVRTIIDETILKYRQEGWIFNVFFCDLDHFKQINDRHGEPTGDRVIGEIAGLLEEITRPGAILLHRSGDEFIVLHPRKSLEESLLLSDQIIHTIASHDFKIGQQVGISVGISTSTLDKDTISYQYLESRAEKATKVSETLKHRGTARIERIDCQPAPWDDITPHQELSLCIINSSLTKSFPFANPWLNVLSFTTYQAVLNCGLGNFSAQTIVEQFMAWTRPNINDSQCASSRAIDQGCDSAPSFSVWDVFCATAHGLIRAGIENTDDSFVNKAVALCYTPDPAAELTLQIDGNVLLRFEHFAGFTARTCCLGYIPECNSQKEAKAVVSPRAILIKIGHHDLNLPQCLFAEVIVVDDRPTRGGGLPDFWEATIARLIAAIEGNRSIDAIYIIGQQSYAKQTVSRLLNAHLWTNDIEQIAYKTGMSGKSIQLASERIAGKVECVTGELDLLNKLTTIYSAPVKYLPPFRSELFRAELRFLHRELQMDGKALGRKDGCRVNTVAEAYPFVLEIARHIKDEDTIFDQAGQTLRELVDFKVHLTTPEQDQIPRFYFKEAESLQLYFHEQFIAPEGLFASQLQTNGQLEAVLDHLINIISKSGIKFATRRAILIIPHEVRQGQDLTPLGLISIRIVPRFLEGKVILAYSYTWRTVEALVGFPYSLFGSVRYGQHLTEEIKRRLEPELARNVRMGDVSYIAHSLHIFMDAYGQNIARRIIDDASI